MNLWPFIKTPMRKCGQFFLLCSILASAVALGQTPTKSAITNILEDEQKRISDLLRENQTDAPYFMSFEVTDSKSVSISASFGGLRDSGLKHTRQLDVGLRVGDFILDNTNGRGGGGNSARLPIEDDRVAIRYAIGKAVDDAYQNAVDALSRLRTQKDTTVADEYPANNFSPAPKQIRYAFPVEIRINQIEWEQKLRDLSAIFKNYPDIYISAVTLSTDSTSRYFVNTEGTSLQHGKNLVRVSIVAVAKSDDGMELFRVETFDSTTLDGLPGYPMLSKAVEKVAADVVALKKAPVTDPYTGPAILSGRASGVFFHEIFGHRIEGHRQKDNLEGNTFTARVNQHILPKFISVRDDPTLARFQNMDLNGFYAFDSEGVSAQNVLLVENGVLKNFLMSRSPIVGFPVSNGHGRASPGFSPVSRQGNLIVEAATAVTNARLRQMLLDEVRRQGKTFGLFFEDISGGFTNTTRNSTQSFQVTPVMVYRVFLDGRPDELVRGADLIGTPLTSFSKILAAGDESNVFNGFCGAESGFIPVSAISPAILISQIEVQKRAKGNSLLPILPPPATKPRIRPKE